MRITYTKPTGEAYRLFDDLTNETHVLIAGETRCGKSVVIAGILHNLLYNSPVTAQFIIIDPKRVDMIEYSDMPHTIKYASRHEEMYEALNLAVKITEQRNDEMQRRRIKKWDGSHLYVFIDEFADLMITDGKRVTPLIQRLCQIGGAARVHVIAATQCPTADIISTKIKVNFTARLGLHTASRQDSRNILDICGCETLPQHGKGYLRTPGNGTRLINIPMYDDIEIKRLIDHWHDKKNIKRHIF